MRRFFIGLLALAAPTGVGAVVLGPFLQAVVDNARAPTPVRADVTIVRGEQRTGAVLLAWRDVLYLETADGFRALVRRGKPVVVQNGHPARAPLRTQVPGTDVLVEDLPFAGVPLAFPQIHDEGPDEVVIAGAPAGPSLYVLVVHTIDPEKVVIVATKYYKDDIATLFKMRRDRDFVLVDGHWRPGASEFEDFTSQSTTRLGLAWKVAPDLPQALFTPAGLKRPSGITIPAPR